MPFSALGLSPALVQAASLLGYTDPTPVQTQAIPAVLHGSDVQGQAQTGSGKTAAFALPLLQRLQAAPPAGRLRPLRALVLVPTRELASQVGEVMRHLARPLASQPTQALKVAVVFGGVSLNPQMMALRGGADAVVATPGRLLDLVRHNALSLSTVRHLVLDEADRLLDLGFADELQQILQLLPRQRQTLLFSATFAPDVQGLADALLQDPVRISVAATQTCAPDIAQLAYRVDARQRTTLLRHLIRERGWQQVLVFVASQHAAQHVAQKLCRHGLNATAFHGGLSQAQRQQVLAEFKLRRWDVLVTTDLAARGIDIAQLPVVVNFDLPRAAVDYVHRIGRTGRAGASGLAISFVTPEALAHWHLIHKRQHLEVVLEQVVGFEPAEAAPPPALPSATPPSGTGGIKGKRPSKKDKLRAAAASTQTSPRSSSSSRT